jgi:hypothetical protein
MRRKPFCPHCYAADNSQSARIAKKFSVNFFAADGCGGNYWRGPKHEALLRFPTAESGCLCGSSPEENEYDPGVCTDTSSRRLKPALLVALRIERQFACPIEQTPDSRAFAHFAFAIGSGKGQLCLSDARK